MKNRQLAFFSIAIIVVIAVGSILWFKDDKSFGEVPTGLSEVPLGEYPVRPLRIGSEDAPIEIFDFSSLTCPHCKTFHTQILPSIKEEYIDTGQAALLYFDFPLDNIAFAASVYSRCVPDDTRAKILDVLFTTQADWLAQQNPLAHLLASGRLIGIDLESYNKCVENEQILSAIRAEKTLGADVFKVQGTPSVYVNGKKITPLSVANLKLAIEEAKAGL